MELTHFNEQGRARMVDVSEKAQTFRVARAEATVCMAKATMDKIKEGTIGKGDVLAVAQVAGIMAAKKNSELIPMCHPLLLTGVDIHFELYPEKQPTVIFLAKNTVDNREKFFAKNPFGIWIAKNYNVECMQETDSLCIIRKR